MLQRTLYALKVLDLIDESGKPTSVFESLRTAPEGEYKTRMAEWLRVAYADALKFINLDSSDGTQIRDAFRSYRPVGQQDRMVSLFVGLFQAAGVIAEVRKPREKRSAKNSDMPRRAKIIAEVATPQHNQMIPKATDVTVMHKNTTNSVALQLLEKFPAFDPAWPDDIKAKWFEGYEKLLSLGQKE